LEREVLGIYLEENRLQWTCFRRTFTGWAPKRPGRAIEPSGDILKPSPLSLREFLSSLSPSRKRVICLGLSRSSFFSRDVRLPPMPLEDALLSIKNSLPTYAHLPLDEIYYDVHLCPVEDRSVNALILYARRSDMEGYLSVFDDTGHRSCLRGPFPVSLGVGAWLKSGGQDFPLGVILAQDGHYELAVYQRRGCLMSVTWPRQEGRAGGDLPTQVAKNRYPDLNDRVFLLGEDGSPGFPSSSGKKLRGAPPITENLGVAAAAVALFGYQEIAIDGSPPKIKVFKVSRVVIPLLVLLFLGLAFQTRQTRMAIQEKEAETATVTAQVQQLQNKLKPLESRRESLKKTQKLVADLDAFIATRPRLFTAINEAAKSIPEGTWFSQLVFRKDTVTLRGESVDALKVIEGLRASSLFELVKLQGSVSRSPEGKDRFGLTIKLKGQSADE
jgi:Tfp pilus assembly protein PilN